MDKYSIEITQPAEFDITEIVSYISRELLVSTIAKKMIQRIVETVATLEEFSYRNGLVRDKRLALQGIRKILIDSYIIFYKVNEEQKTVTIIRILYSKRNWLSIL